MSITRDHDNLNGPPTFQQLAAIIRGRARADGPCPACSQFRKPGNQKRPVLRVWRGDSPGILIFSCIHCGVHGFRTDGERTSEIDQAAIARARREAAARQATEDEKKRMAARAMWARRLPISGTVAERYLRETRAIIGPLPKCLVFLPAFDRDPPALAAPFGMPIEEADELQWPMTRVNGVQRLFLSPEATKIGVLSRGLCGSHPIVLSPFTDSNSLIITEGIEDGLSAHAATALATWAAGGARYMPHLVDAVPDFVEQITVLTDRDADGIAGARALTEGLRARGFGVRQIWSAPNG